MDDPRFIKDTTIVTRPLVSVVTPFYNTASYLAQCIESVLKQSYSEFEYILMDNCSTDGSSEIAETYARRDLPDTFDSMLGVSFTAPELQPRPGRDFPSQPVL